MAAAVDSARSPPPVAAPNLPQIASGDSRIAKAGPSVGERANARFRRRNVGRATEVRKERDERLHRHLQKKTADGSSPRVATPEEVEQVAAMLNKRMCEIIVDPLARSWFKLFNHMDDDCSGKINYHEWEDMLRNELKMAASQFPDELLEAIWRALDEDSSGLITCGEFGHFMRKGVHVLNKAESGPARAFKAKKAEIGAFRESHRRQLSEQRESRAAELAAMSKKASECHDYMWGIRQDGSPFRDTGGLQAPSLASSRGGSANGSYALPWRSPRAHVF